MVRRRFSIRTNEWRLTSLHNNSSSRKKQIVCFFWRIYGLTFAFKINWPLGPQLTVKLTDLKIKYVTFGPKLEFLGILVLYHFKNFNFLTTINTTLKLSDPNKYQLSNFIWYNHFSYLDYYESTLYHCFWGNAEMQGMF